ncbi:right-handed parallel beta-helix repeat-containing protein [Maribellus sediminis]|uniref:right-handed parallel beta-helix repeat-containing protein n=1 Tax=Maribellus sediminis TaxID=2696285 RepID=UPI001432206E|nr:right-handed parallel beta-helix repeat-containing protein [Maribellus sediminis]
MKYLIFLILTTLFLQLNGHEIWVSKSGNDKNPGTKEQPMATLLKAQRKARELRRLNDPSIKEGIRIILKGGTYFLDETLFFRPEDSGNIHSPTIIISADNENAVLSGGVKVSSWQKAGPIKGLPKEARGKVWEANVPKVGGRAIEFRQMWVNGEKATRASTLGDGVLPRILSVDNENETFGIPVPDFEVDNVKQLEFVIHQWWAIANLRVKDLVNSGDSTIISFHQPESRIEFEHPWPAPFLDVEKNQNGNSAFYFVGAIELLNQPGEWYEDLDAGKVYYWPRESENLTMAEVIVPNLETLVRVKGTLESPVSNIIFENIGFEHTSWLRPSQSGHVPLQAGFYLLDAYKLKVPGTPDKAGLENQAWVGRQPGAVEVLNSTNIIFEGCNFQHFAATGLDFIAGASHSQVEGCVFSDIGGTGIQGGFFGDDAFEAHLPYNPSDEREICHHIKISNNLITDCTNEDWGCVGISFGFASDINIEHNEVSHLNYSGICTGWGWTSTVSCQKNNRVHANYIHHFAKMMYDVGGIYNLSVQPKMEISNNRIEDLLKAPYAHIPEHYQYIYLDENSAYVKIINNWTEKDKFFSNSPGPGNEWENNGPQVLDEIKNAAGIQPEYKHILNSIAK